MDLNMSVKLRFFTLVAASAMVLGGFAGCGDGTPPLGKVTGTVTRGGKPVPGVVVNFMPDNGRPSWGKTDAAGKYTLNYDEGNDGGQVGSCKVFIGFEAQSQAGEAGREKGAGGAPADLKEIIEKYSFEKSPLRKDIKGGAQTIDIQLD